MLYLTLRENGDTRNLRFSKFPIAIGRSSTSDVVIESDSVSARHARIDENEGRFTITDLKSTNKTYVAGNLIESCDLSDGDQIQLGDVEIEVRFTEVLEKTRITELKGSSLREARIKSATTMVGMFTLLWLVLCLSSMFTAYLSHWPPKAVGPLFADSSKTFSAMVLVVVVLGVFSRLLTKKFRYKSSIWSLIFFIIGLQAHTAFFHLIAGNGFDEPNMISHFSKILVISAVTFLLVYDMMGQQVWYRKLLVGMLIASPFMADDFVIFIPGKIRPDAGRRPNLEVAMPLFAKWPPALTTSGLAKSMDERKVAADEYRNLVIADQAEDKAEKNGER